jgi:hypothetical protein
MRAWALLVIAIAMPCYAQWSVTILHPSTADQSVGRGAASGIQVGEFNGTSHAALWTGSAGSLVDLHPTGVGAVSSIAYAAALTEQAGAVTFGFSSHASLWKGSAATWVDLNPIGISSSLARATDGGNEVGEINVGAAHAAYWSGSPGAYMDIHPGVADASGAYDVQGGEIAGVAVISGGTHAAYWTGITHMFTDLHPAGASNSWALAVTATQQGGWAALGSGVHAALWSGSAASFVDLNPSATVGSEIYGMDTGVQVGYEQVGSALHAALWHGTAASFVDLQSFMPSGYSNSQARAVWTDGAGAVQVVGYADHATDSGTRIEAILWTAVPEPASLTLISALIPALLRRPRSS